MFKIINLSGPRNMNLILNSGTSTCSEREKNINAEFGLANYTMIIIFNTQSNKFNVTTITDFESYSYNIKEYIYKKKESENNEFIIVNGIKI